VVNERATEELVRGWFREQGYYDDPECWIDEQRPRSQAISTLLKAAGKRGRGGSGNPEFVVTTPALPDFVLLVECKADPGRHESENLDKPADYAVDGALHYARHVSKDFTVVAVGVLATQCLARSRAFLWRKDRPAPSLSRLRMKLNQ
jgi:hypothetical protein